VSGSGARRATSTVRESDLLAAARRGEEWARQELYDRHADRVLAVTRSRLRCAALAEDAAQEAWVRALRALPGFRGDASFGTWIHRIAVNAARNVQRRRQRWARIHRPLPEPCHAAAPPATPLLRGRLLRAVRDLPPGMRRVLLLHAAGYTHAEIAERMGTTRGTSKSQLWSARRHLSESLAGGTGPEGDCRPAA